MRISAAIRTASNSLKQLQLFQKDLTYTSAFMAGAITFRLPASVNIAPISRFPAISAVKTNVSGSFKRAPLRLEHHKMLLAYYSLSGAQCRKYYCSMLATYICTMESSVPSGGHGPATARDLRLRSRIVCALWGPCAHKCSRPTFVQ